MTFSRPQRLKGTIVRYPHPFLRYPTLPLLLILRARLLQKPPSGLIWFQIHLFITKVKLFKCTCLWQRQNTKFFFLRNKAVFLNEVKLYQDVIISSVVIKKQSIAQLLRGPHLGLINKNKLKSNYCEKNIDSKYLEFVRIFQEFPPGHGDSLLT